MTTRNQNRTEIMSDHQRLGCALTLGILTWLSWTTAGAHDREGAKTSVNLLPARPNPVTGRLQRIVAPLPRRYETLGPRQALVTLRVFSPAPNAWRLNNRLGDAQTILDRLPGPARIEVRPCAWSQESVLTAMQSMLRRIQGRPRRNFLRRPARNPRFGRHRVSHGRALSELIHIFGSNGDEKTGSQRSTALLRVLESTLLHLSLGTTCSRASSPTILVGGTAFSLRRAISTKRLTEWIADIYRKERSKAKRAMTNGLPRQSLMAWQLTRAATKALSTGHPPAPRAHDTIRLLTTGPRRSAPIQGGLFLFGSRRKGRRVDLFTPLTGTAQLAHVALLVILAQAFADRVQIFLHPLETRLRQKTLTMARMVTAASLDGSLPGFLDMATQFPRPPIARSPMRGILGRTQLKHLGAIARSSRVTSMLAADLRRITALGRLPITATIVVDGLAVSYGRDNEVLGLLALLTSMRSGMLGRIQNRGAFGFSLQTRSHR